MGHEIGLFLLYDETQKAKFLVYDKDSPQKFVVSISLRFYRDGLKSGPVLLSNNQARPEADIRLS